MTGFFALFGGCDDTIGLPKTRSAHRSLLHEKRGFYRQILFKSANRLYLPKNDWTNEGKIMSRIKKLIDN
ncbi:hypothetical protein CLOSTMETH_02829 [[Clostridium] methylpentosum DSM 5476]|uniref:Uncharacterized protein n=1 Tax=[Clostridium] methylpentosum DSM 5476 TaxID=537013 RepID=C0EG37_9FIRM|nr:hypothetical protein CLOSTMETH_02829 [[Clostridium] methylpentosum DSM 5476]